MPRLVPAPKLRLSVLLGFVVILASCQTLSRNSTRPVEGTLIATVVDERTSKPLGGTLAALSRVGESDSAQSKFIPADSSGILRFGGLTIGRYQLHVKRIGYLQRDTTLEITKALTRANVALIRDPAERNH